MSDRPQTHIAFETIGDNELDTLCGIFAVIRAFNLTAEQKRRVAEYMKSRMFEMAAYQEKPSC